MDRYIGRKKRKKRKNEKKREKKSLERVRAFFLRISQKLIAIRAYFETVECAQFHGYMPVDIRKSA